MTISRTGLGLLAALTLLLIVAVLDVTAAQARMGGGSGFMDSPGYQRRLQESRGQVTNQSGSLSQPYTQPPAVYPRRSVRAKRSR